MGRPVLIGSTFVSPSSLTGARRRGGLAWGEATSTHSSGPARGELIGMLLTKPERSPTPSWRREMRVPTYQALTK
jgi:hypothetical protein